MEVGKTLKIADADIVMVPGYTNSGPDHWMSRWESKFSTARRVEQDDWLKPVVEDWTSNLVTDVEKGRAPIVLIAHSLGCQVVANAVQQMSDAQREAVAGAFLVAPPDVENPAIRPRHLMTFGPYRREPLPFPSIVVGSQNDHFCSLEKAEEMAASWGSLFLDSGESGHLNAESGHGPWPEGLMVLAEFMKNIDRAN